MRPRAFVCLILLAVVLGSVFAVPMWPATASAENPGPQDERSTAEPPNSFTIPGYAFDRGNAKTFTSNWADGEPMVAFGGQIPVVIDYDIPFPVDGTYTLHTYYAAAGARPVKLYVDGKAVADVCRTATGSWMTKQAQWEESATFTVKQGKHTVRLLRDAAFPHVVKLRFNCDKRLPEGWVLKRPKARKLDSPPPQPLLLSHKPEAVKIEPLRMAIEDLAEAFGAKYPKADEYLARLDRLAAKRQMLETRTSNGEPIDEQAAETLEKELIDLRREALLSNPLLDFDKLLLVKRHTKGPRLGLPQNWQSNSSLPRSGYNDEIAVLSPVEPEGELSTLYKPQHDVFVGDVDLHFDAGRMLFSSVGENGRWQIFEIAADGSGLRQLTGEEPDVDSYDACYLPNDKITFTSTAYFVGVPCVYGSSHVAPLYVMDGDGNNIRQLCFDQEHNWCPTVMNNGRVLYLRWEYTDTPHSNTRLLFHMNPDGTEQMEYYGSNSYWPNSTFFARPVPNHPTKVVGVIGGHHDNPRMGELVVFDPALGRREAQGAVQRIPGHGQEVEMIIRDGLTRSSWPKFLHPWPLSDKYFLVACKPNQAAHWGIYLVDVFDNVLLLKETPGYALLEPIPFRARPTPPVIPEKVNLKRKDAVVYLPDIYEGDGLKGIPRGTVKELRLFTYHYAYQHMGGLLGVIGMDGPWDIKRVMGSVPVHEDGSAHFRVPANTPISIQPLDGEGKALQLMRSWMTAMPGEVVQCAGCHESQNTAPPARMTMALAERPAEIKPWYGPTRGFSYAREVQPVIDRHCIGCHNGEPWRDGREIPNLRGDVKLTDWKSVTPGNGGGHAGKFSVGYAELHRFVRRPGIESDYHMLEPMEFHADTTQLVQMLRKGHHGVELDDEGWDRLITWIDLNCPFHGTWGEELAKPGVQVGRRKELLKKYAGVDDDPEKIVPLSSDSAYAGPQEPIVPERATPTEVISVEATGWPFDAAEAEARQQAAGPKTRRTIELENGLKIDLALVPAGEFVMGSASGYADEQPACRVRIDRPFWMATCEVTNAQFALFDPAHDSRVESKNTYQFGIHGYPMNRPEQPVVRVSWHRAMAFCRWLSEQSGLRCSLPTEAQWEYACRAGSNSPMFFGDKDADFSAFANLSDATMTKFASNPYTVDSPLKNPTKYDDWIPKDPRHDDGSLLTVAPGSYQPNAWGLYDVHGNAAEWTRTAYRPYPYVIDDGRDEPKAAGLKVARGGSWRDRPKRATASFRVGFHPYQKVYNVGFRIVCEAESGAVAAR